MGLRVKPAMTASAGMKLRVVFCVPKHSHTMMQWSKSATIAVSFIYFLAMTTLFWPLHGDWVKCVGLIRTRIVFRLMGLRVKPAMTARVGTESRAHLFTFSINDGRDWGPKSLIIALKKELINVY